MTRFSSDRERRLWLWTLAIVVSIYATLGVTPTVAGALRQRGLLELSFVVALLLVMAAVVVHGLRARPSRAEIVVALGVTACYLLVMVRIALPEERTHLIEYGVVGIFIHQALTERASHGRAIPMTTLRAILATAVLGVLDECIQALLPNRVFDPRDILFNVLAGTMAVGASVALAWARQRFGASHRPQRRP